VLINSRWTYGGTPEKEAFIRSLIENSTTMGARLRRNNNNNSSSSNNTGQGLAAMEQQEDDVQGEHDEGRLVAWVLQQDYGPMGMLHTEPAVRRQGVGMALVIRLAQAMCVKRAQALQAHRREGQDSVAQGAVQGEAPGQVEEQGDPRPLLAGAAVLPPLPCAYIVRGNQASELLFTKAGFAPVEVAEWCLISAPLHV
jgi:GNAT superfamily N-acetyltransferase